MRYPFQLKPFHDQDSPPISIKGEVIYAGSTLRIRYNVEGKLEDIVLPEQTRTGQADFLWQHTCFECFLLLPDGKQYIECNFSPTGEWAIYKFDDYRQPSDRIEKIVVKSIRTQCNAETYQLDSFVELDHFPIKNIGISAVIESKILSYWALKHVGEQPDFHQQSSFVLLEI